MRLHINPELLPYFKGFPLFIQRDKGTGHIAGEIFGYEVINNKAVNGWVWV